MFIRLRFDRAFFYFCGNAIGIGRCDQAVRFARVMIADLAVKEESKGVAECDLGSLQLDRLDGA
jgi:hypothetical protein